jgi:phthalate 4,5-dioxygenase reductase component
LNGAEQETEPDALALLVTGKREVARAIWLFDLQSLDGEALPQFEPGAHLLVRVPAGLLRRYSLCSAPSDRTRYQIAVKHETAGSGGSGSMIEDLRPSDILSASPPANYFALDRASTHSLLIAGGIGITPILAMARHLRAQDAPFELIYCARSAEAAAFLDVLAAPEFADRTTIHYDGGDPAASLDFHARLAEHPAGAHVYCCGPRPLMESVRDATRHWPSGTVHFEDFGTGATEAAGTDVSGFRIRLARSGEVLTVGANETILAALRRHGLDVPSSCEAGTCGTCRVGLLAGAADHRDLVLNDDEHVSAIMVCVSRARSEELTLDT